MRYWPPFRRLLLKLSDWLPESLQERLLEYLYPDDAIITFKGDDECQQ